MSRRDEALTTRSAGPVSPPYSSQQAPHPSLAVSYHPSPGSGICIGRCCSFSHHAGSARHCWCLPAMTGPASCPPAAGSGEKAEPLVPHRHPPSQHLHPTPQGPPGKGQGTGQDTRCLPRERCPGPLWPHPSFIEAEDRCWVPISLADQLHVIPFLHQRRGRHDLQLHVLCRVWGRREREGSVRSPATEHWAAGTAPSPRLTEDSDVDSPRLHSMPLSPQPIVHSTVVEGIAVLPGDVGKEGAAHRVQPARLAGQRGRDLHHYRGHSCCSQPAGKRRAPLGGHSSFGLPQAASPQPTRPWVARVPWLLSRAARCGSPSPSPSNSLFSSGCSCSPFLCHVMLGGGKPFLLTQWAICGSRETLEHRVPRWGEGSPAQLGASPPTVWSLSSPVGYHCSAQRCLPGWAQSQGPRGPLEREATPHILGGMGWDPPLDPQSGCTAVVPSCPITHCRHGAQCGSRPHRGCPPRPGTQRSWRPASSPC